MTFSCGNYTSPIFSLLLVLFPEKSHYECQTCYSVSWETERSMKERGGVSSSVCDLFWEKWGKQWRRARVCFGELRVWSISSGGSLESKPQINYHYLHKSYGTPIPDPHNARKKNPVTGPFPHLYLYSLFDYGQALHCSALTSLILVALPGLPEKEHMDRASFISHACEFCNLYQYSPLPVQHPLIGHLTIHF